MAMIKGSITQIMPIMPLKAKRRALMQYHLVGGGGLQGGHAVGLLARCKNVMKI